MSQQPRQRPDAAPQPLAGHAHRPAANGMPMGPWVPPAAPRPVGGPVRRNPVLGWTGLTVVLAAGIAIVIVAHHAGRLFGELVRANGRDVGNVDQLHRLHPEWFVPLQHDLVIAALLSALGLLGWIVCIIAVVRGSARVAAILGVVLGMVSVVVALVVFTLTLVPYIPQG